MISKFSDLVNNKHTRETHIKHNECMIVFIDQLSMKKGHSLMRQIEISRNL